MENINEALPTLTRMQWWERRRLKYNIGLVVAGGSAFITWAILAQFLIVPYDHEFEITLFTIAFQGFGYLIMMGIANLFYFLGCAVDAGMNTDDSEKFRQRLFNLGFWFSFGLPFLIPLLTIVIYLVEYRK